MSTGRVLFHGVIFLWQALDALVGLSRQRWDVVHFHNFVPDGLLLGMWNWPKAKVHVLTNHSSQYLMAMKSGKMTLPYRALTRAVGQFVAPSRQLRAETSPILRSGQIVRYIPNGVDAQLFSPGEPSDDAYATLGVSRDRRIVLAARRHSPKCGLQFLIKAVPAVVDRHPDVVFCLVGSGEQTNYLKALAQELGLSECVRFPGAVDHNVLPDLFRAAYISVLPSLYEAVSLAGLEFPGMWDSCGWLAHWWIPSFVLDGTTGMLVEPASPPALATAINRLLEDPGRRAAMSKAGRVLVLESYTWRRVAAALLDFYSELERMQAGGESATA